MLKNEAGTRGRREKGRVLVVVQRKEASIEEKIGGDKEVPQCIYMSKQPVVRNSCNLHIAARDLWDLASEDQVSSSTL